MTRRGGRPRLLALALAAGCATLAAPEARAIGADRPLDELISAQWRQEEGLAQDTVYTIVQTRDGFLWCGTRAGLSRFDGVRFRNFGREEMRLEQTARIQALAEDADGALWIGTGSGELLRYQDGTFEHFTAAGPDGDGRSFGRIDGRIAGRIAGLAAGAAGELWVATYSEGVFRHAGGRFEPVPELAGITSITRLALDEAGDLWIATIGKGVFRFRGGAPLLHLGRQEGLPNDYVSSLAAARGGGVWIGTHSGICRWREGRLEVFGAARGLVHDHVTALREDHAGNVFFASFGGGLQRLRPDGRVDLLPAGEKGREAIAWDICEDRSGAIWTGTVDQGLLLLADGPFSTWRAYSGGGLPSRLVTALAKDAEGTFWIGTRDAGLGWRRDGAADGSTSPPSGRIGRAEGLAADTVWALDPDDGGVWAGTSRGLYRVSRAGAAAVPLELFASPPAVQALTHDAATRYVGTDDGLLLLPKKGGAAPRRLTRRDGLPADSVFDLERDPRGRLWIATAGGLAVWDGESVARVGVYDRLGAGPPLALLADASGALWVVAGAGGLVRVAGGEAAGLGRADGLLDDSFYAIFEDRAGFFWLGASSGILRVSRGELEAKLRDRRRSLPQKLFDRLDGVAPGAVPAFGKRSAAGRDGRLHLATFDGVALQSANETLAAAPPRALVESVEIDGRGPLPAAAASFSSFSGASRTVSFELAAPLPHAGRQIRLRYRLSGNDRDWVEAGPERRATYTGLVPGLYRFEVEASAVDGEYRSAPAVLDFRVEAGFFKSWRFPAALMLLLAALALALHFWRSRQLLARQRELDTRIVEASADIRLLQGLLPLCGSCNKVRDDQGYWQQVETYLAQSTELEFTHGFCPDCARQMMAQFENEPTSAAG